MNNKIDNLYNQMVVTDFIDNKMFKILIYLSDIKQSLATQVPCSKYAKFIINDFKSLVNNSDGELYGKVEPSKLRALFSISEEYCWFTRKELISFLEFKNG